MPKFRNENEPTINMIEQGNGIDKGRYLPGHSIDMIFCHPPNYNNSNDKLLNNWGCDNDYYQWFRTFANIAANKLKKTGVFYLIGDIDNVNKLISIIEEFGFIHIDTYYFTKNRKNNGVRKITGKNVKVIESIFVFIKDFQKDIKKLLKLKQQEAKKSAREINMELTGNPNGGGYWSLYCGENSRNMIPTEEHWEKLKILLDIDIEYENINTQYRMFEGENLWEDINYEDDKFLSGVNIPVILFERLIKMNRKNPEELIIWDPFCGYGNSTLACRKLKCKYYAQELDMKVYFKAMINTGNSVNISKPLLSQQIETIEI